MPANRNLTLDLKPEPGVRMAALIGKWNFESAENLDAYMDKVGVADNMKEMARNAKPVVEICQDGDQWTIKTFIADKEKDVRFKLGEEFDNTTLTGETVKSLITMDGDAMIEKYNYKGFPIEIRRQVVGGKLVSKMSVDGETVTITLTRIS